MKQSISLLNFIVYIISMILKKAQCSEAEKLLKILGQKGLIW